VWRIVLQTIRIIAGKWRGRKITFPDVEGLRPTPNRVRETVFNWLMPILPGARCLDLFAGSGALGFEALSRGAKEVLMFDRSKEVVDSLRANVNRLEAQQAQIFHANIPKEWPLAGEKFDVVFLDPPFKSGLLELTLELLPAILAEGAYIYLESSCLSVKYPENLLRLKEKKAGGVHYGLFQFNGVL
jgi:16S rRNA (guanine966-N2)-methyltransferase